MYLQARTSTGQPPGRIQLVEDAEQPSLTAQQSRIAQDELARAVVGTPVEALAQLHELARRYGVDEVMLNPVASAWRGTDPATAPGRESTLRLLAEALS